MKLSASTQPSPQALRDFALITRIVVHHEEKARAELFNRYRQPVYSRVYRMVGAGQEMVAEDLTIEALTRAYDYLPSFQPRFSFEKWLFRIATNHCIDFLRRRRLKTVSLHVGSTATAQSAPFFDFPDSAPTPQEALIIAQRHEHLHHAVAQLPARYQQLIKQHYFEGLSYEEIAMQHRLPLGTVKGNLHQCRALLAKRLSGILSTI